jgi:predicted transcriptional regulator
MATILPVQCWVARAVLGWNKQKLAKVAGVSRGTVARFEGGSELKASTVEAIQYALEKAGVVLISADDGGPGARLTKQAHLNAEG